MNLYDEKIPKARRAGPVSMGRHFWNALRGAVVCFSMIMLLCSLSLVVLPGSARATPACDAAPVGLVGFDYSAEGEAYAIDLREVVTPGDVEVYAYVGDIGSPSLGRGEGVLNVFDVTDPCNPVLAGFSRTGTSGPGYFEELPDVDVHGETGYLANDAHGFVVYDISDPANPVRGAWRKDGRYAVSVAYDGVRYAYVGYSYTGGAELKVYDMFSFPISPPAAVYDTVSGGRHATSLYLDGDRLYMRALNGEETAPGFEIVDVSVPTSPAFVGAVQINRSTHGQMGEVKVRGSYAYVATGEPANEHDGGLVVIDISNEASPSIVAAVFIPDAATVGWEAPGIDLAGDYACVPGKSGLYLFDISDPLTPFEADHFPYPAEFLPSKGGQVVVRDNFAYVTSFTGDAPTTGGGLAVYKLWETVPPVLEVMIDIKPSSDPNCIHNNGKGVIPVALFGSESLDVTHIDVASLALEGLSIKAAGKKQKLLVHQADVNGDGIVDLMMQFQDEAGAFSPGQTEAALTGKLLEAFGGNEIVGHDSICLVPKAKGK